MATEIILCDTDVVIDYFNINHQRHDQVKNLIEEIIGHDNVLLSAITKMELLVGARNKEELIKINKQLTRFNIALINDLISQAAIDLINQYKLSHGLAIPDALVAATSLTFNTKDHKFIDDLNLFEF